MSLEAVKALVKKAFEDKEFKDRLFSRPEETLARFDLTSEEKEAICVVNTRVGLVKGPSGELAILQKPLIDWLSGGP